VDDEADHRESDTTHESEILMKQHIMPGTYFQVIDDEEMTRSLQQTNLGTTQPSEEDRGSERPWGIGCRVGTFLEILSHSSSNVGRTGCFQNVQQGPAS